MSASPPKHARVGYDANTADRLSDVFAGILWAPNGNRVPRPPKSGPGHFVESRLNCRLSTIHPHSMTWFTENPWPPIFILGLVVCALLAVWSSQKRGIWLIGVFAAVALAVAIFFVEK